MSCWTSCQLSTRIIKCNNCIAGTNCTNEPSTGVCTEHRRIGQETHQSSHEYVGKRMEQRVPCLMVRSCVQGNRGEATISRGARSRCTEVFRTVQAVLVFNSVYQVCRWTIENIQHDSSSIHLNVNCYINHSNSVNGTGCTGMHSSLNHLVPMLDYNCVE